MPMFAVRSGAATTTPGRPLRRSASPESVRVQTPTPAPPSPGRTGALPRVGARRPAGGGDGQRRAELRDAQAQAVSVLAEAWRRGRHLVDPGVEVALDVAYVGGLLGG